MAIGQDLDPEQLIMQMIQREQSPLFQIGTALQRFGAAYRGAPDPEPVDARMARQFQLAQGLQQVQGQRVDRMAKGIQTLGELAKNEELSDETYEQLGGQMINMLGLSKELGGMVTRKERPALGALHSGILPLIGMTEQQLGGVFSRSRSKPEDVKKALSGKVAEAFQREMNKEIAGGTSRLDAPTAVMEKFPPFRAYDDVLGYKPPQASAEMVKEEEKLQAVRSLWPTIQTLPPEQQETILGLLGVDAAKLIGTQLKGAGARAETFGRQAGEAAAYQDPSISAALAAQKGREAGATAEAQMPYQLKVSAAQGREAAAIAQDKPFTTTELNNILDPKTYRPVAFGTTPSEAKKSGAIFITERTSNRLDEINGAEAFIDQLEELGASLYGPGGPLEQVTKANAAAGRLSGAVRSQLNQVTQSDPTIQNAKGLINLYQTQLSRSVAGERGASTQMDVDRAAKAAPKLEGFPDTRETFESQLATARSLLQKIRAGIVGKQTTPPNTPAAIKRKADEYLERTP